MPSPRREYVSLQERSRQRTLARSERNRLLGLVRRDPGPSRTVTITDEQLAQADRDFAERTMANLTPIYAGPWQQLSTAFTTITTTATNAAATINAAANRFIPTGALTTTMGVYNPTTYTTTFTVSEADLAYWASWNTQYVETEEQRRLREEREAAMAERTRQHRAEVLARAAHMEAAEATARAEMEAAEATARELLMAHLDAQQKRDALEYGWFEVVSDKGRRWRIRLDSYTANVDLMPEDGDARLASYCAHGRGVMPTSDHHLVQKLVLEADEDQFISVANVHYRSATAVRDGGVIPDRRAANTAALRAQVENRGLVA